MSEADRLAVLQQVEYRFPIFYSFVERNHQQNPGLTSQMYDLLMWKKGLVARSEESLRRKILVTNDHVAIGLFDDLAARRSQISEFMNSPEARSEQGRKIMTSLQVQANEVESKLAVESKIFFDLQRQQSATWDKVRESLNQTKAHAAVEFVRFPFFDPRPVNGRLVANSVHYVALIVLPQSTEPMFVELGQAAKLEGEPRRAYRRWVSQLDNDSLDKDQRQHALQAFYEFTWKKVDAHERWLPHSIRKSTGPMKPAKGKPGVNLEPKARHTDFAGFEIAA